MRDGIQISEAQLTRYDVFTADECFLTGTAAEIIPVVRVDNRAIGSGTPGSTIDDGAQRICSNARSARSNAAPR